MVDPTGQDPNAGGIGLGTQYSTVTLPYAEDWMVGMRITVKRMETGWIRDVLNSDGGAPVPSGFWPTTILGTDTRASGSSGCIQTRNGFYYQQSPFAANTPNSYSGLTRLSGGSVGYGCPFGVNWKALVIIKADNARFSCPRKLFCYQSGIGAVALDPFNNSANTNGLREIPTGGFTPSGVAEFILTKSGYPNEIAQQTIPGVGNGIQTNASNPFQTYPINSLVWQYIGHVSDS